MSKAKTIGRYTWHKYGKRGNTVFMAYDVKGLAGTAWQDKYLNTMAAWWRWVPSAGKVVAKAEFDNKTKGRQAGEAKLPCWSEENDGKPVAWFVYNAALGNRRMP